MKAASPAVVALRPRSSKTLWTCGARSVQSGPPEAPSNVVEPIITHSSATVPGSTGSDGRPSSGRRR